MPINTFFVWLRSKIKRFSRVSDNAPVANACPYPHLIGQSLWEQMMSWQHMLYARANITPATITELKDTLRVEDRLYRSALGNLGIYNAQDPVGSEPPNLGLCAKHVLTMLDQAWVYQCQFPQHWYMRPVPVQAVADHSTIDFGFCRIQRHGEVLIDLLFVLGDASVPCRTEAWIAPWLEQYAKLSATDAFSKAVRLLRDDAKLAQAREMFPTVVLLSWLDAALALSTEIDVALLDDDIRYYGLLQNMRPNATRVSWNRSLMDVHAQYTLLQREVQYHGEGTFPMSSADALDLSAFAH